MTMPYSPGRALFEGNGTATDFPFSFKVWGTEQLTVTLTGPDGNSRPASGWTARLNDDVDVAGQIDTAHFINIVYAVALQICSAHVHHNSVILRRSRYLCFLL